MNQNFNNDQHTDIPNIVPEFVPDYIRKRISITDKYDRHYARYLQSNMFRNYVIEHDAVNNTEPDLYKAIHKERIFTIFENIHMNQAQNEIERFLQLEAINIGFVILMDDKRTAWIYIHEFENRFQQWEYDGVEDGLSSRSFFQ
jgi:hypothetical protein